MQRAVPATAEEGVKGSERQQGEGEEQEAEDEAEEDEDWVLTMIMQQGMAAANRKYHNKALPNPRSNPKSEFDSPKP